MITSARFLNCTSSWNSAWVPTTIGVPLAICSRRHAVLALELAGQPRDFDAQRFEPALEGDEVLLGEDLGGRHQAT
jgi:hypothetical protein